MSHTRIPFQIIAMMPAAALAGALVTASPAAPPEYLAEGLGSIGGDQSMPLAMNDMGMIVGWAETVEGAGKTARIERHAFAWSDGLMTDLDTLGGPYSEARGVNNQGQVVGIAELPNGRRRATYWHDGVIIDLNERIVGLDPISFEIPAIMRDRDTLVPRTPDAVRDLRAVPEHPAAGGCFAGLEEFIEANAINDDGWIVGCGIMRNDEFLHGILLRPNPHYDELNPYWDYTDLGQLPKARECVAHAISNAGRVVGESDVKAFAWSGRMHPLETFAEDSAALDVNVHGDAVGWCGEFGLAPHACVWRGGDRWELIVQCMVASEARAINDDGIVVGWVETELEKRRTAIKWVGHQPFDLNALAVVAVPTFDRPWDWLHEATDIDSKGRIIGYGSKDGDRGVRAFLLTPLDTVE